MTLRCIAPRTPPLRTCARASVRRGVPCINVLRRGVLLALTGENDGICWGLWQTEPYWQKDAYIRVERPAAEELQKATYTLHSMCLQAVDQARPHPLPDHRTRPPATEEGRATCARRTQCTLVNHCIYGQVVNDKSGDLMDLFDIPPELREAVTKSWKLRQQDVLGVPAACAQALWSTQSPHPASGSGRHRGHVSLAQQALASRVSRSERTTRAARERQGVSTSCTMASRLPSCSSAHRTLAQPDA